MELAITRYYINPIPKGWGLKDENPNLNVRALYSACNINIPSENADTSNEKEDSGYNTLNDLSP